MCLFLLPMFISCPQRADVASEPISLHSVISAGEAALSSGPVQGAAVDLHPVKK